jgi:hypothetical protein
VEGAVVGAAVPVVRETKAVGETVGKTGGETKGDSVETVGMGGVQFSIKRDPPTLTILI